MKKIFLILFCITATVSAQKNKIIKTNPLGAIFKIYTLGYEQETKEKQSFTVDVLYSNFSLADFKIKGPGISAGYRFYFQNKDPFEGWFAGPSMSFSKLKFGLENTSDGIVTSSELNLNGVKIDTTNSQGDITASSFVIGAVAGYQWNWNPITLELFLSAGNTSISYEDEGSLSGSESSFGFNSLGFSVGYSF